MPTSHAMLARFATVYTLGDAAIDATHREFLELCVAAGQTQGAAFGAAFQHLLEHTRAHFAAEEARMQVSGYPALGEHRAHHRQLLGDMERLGQRASAGRPAMARAWLAETLPQWFDLHARTMDSALIAHLRQAG